MLALPPLVIEGLEEFKGSFDRLCLQAGTSAIEAMLELKSLRDINSTRSGQPCT
jgi:hypothetical protein